ncbi:MAG: sigma 54-interacting transcriptional regulator [Tissierellia bacterium]|nr:sigma 54-interacting transcriptional regulator [Tissierellia bacterium]
MDFNSGNYIKLFTDMMFEGFIVIDRNGKIQIYNEKAKEIFGIIPRDEISHRKGKIEKGDIVVLGDNIIGEDDGELDPDSLKLLGIKNKKIQRGDSLIAIGLYDDEGIEPVYKYLKKGRGEEILELSGDFLNIPINIKINFIHKYISIKIENKEYLMNYINAIGHMVIIDGKSKTLKFYQSPGYTVRRESINEILKGGKFRGKGKYREDLDVIGEDIFEIHRSDSIIEEFYKVAQGEDIVYRDKFEEINGIPTLCNLLPVEGHGKRMGAALKVEDISQIKKIIAERDNAIRKLELAESQLLEEEALNRAFPRFVGNSKEIEQVKRLALKSAKTSSNVLILGESGTGKSLLAKSIHKNSKLKGKPFVHVNCGAIPETLLESELFGYEEGAFTGARKGGKKGFFEMANGGTIFLDEIGDISPSLQIKLLEVIQEKSFYKIGGGEKITVDVRIISATNKNLEEEMHKGKFREDLYYRINVFPIWIPPLRDRKQDIIPLVELLLPKICEEIDCENKRISAEALNLILEYHWPGNVRELENILERAVNLADGNIILSKHISLKVGEFERENEAILSLKEAIEKQEKKSIEEALLLFNGNKKKAWEALEISKTTFYERLSKYNIEY